MSRNGTSERVVSRAPLREKSFLFAVRIVKLCQRMHERDREYVLSRQITRSGTAIGALIREAELAESRADFAHKIAISRKEAGETEYWLELLKETDYLTLPEFQSLHKDLTELLRLLTATLKTTRGRQESSCPAGDRSPLSALCSML